MPGSELAAAVATRRFLRAEYARLSDEALLAYFRRRRSVRYFAVADAGEVERAKIDHILDNRFQFNGESHQLPEDFDWLINPSRDIEWAIMWHKFYFAVGLGIAYAETGFDRYARKWQKLTSRWINEVPIDHLSSDVTGRRIQNWIFAHYYFITKTPDADIDAGFYADFLQSLESQVDYLCDHLTPARNHRTLELYAIFLTAVVFPEFEQAGRWREFSVAELAKNIAGDFLPDGVHCELSTDYHHIVLRNFLGIKRLAGMNGIELPAEIDDGIRKALVFAQYVHKPDGDIPSLSDGDCGSYLDLLKTGYRIYGDETLRYVATRGDMGQAPSDRSKAFPDGGYYILRSDWGTASAAYRDARYLVFDCGPLGAGNHGHLDLLSFEMAAFGRSLIVDPGRYSYDESGDINWRVKFRGTSYHNTVVVDGLNQTNYAFHTRKYKIKGPAPDHELRDFVSRDNVDYLHGIARSHQYPVVHERKILFPHFNYWVICDLLTATAEHHYELLFHLSELAQNRVWTESDRDNLFIHSPQLLMIQPTSLSGALTVEEGYVSRRYGIKHPAPIVKVSRRASVCCFCTILYPHRGPAPVIVVTNLDVRDPADGSKVASTDAVALKISITDAGRTQEDIVYFRHRSDRSCAIGDRLLNEAFGLLKAEVLQ